MSTAPGRPKPCPASSGETLSRGSELAGASLGGPSAAISASDSATAQPQAWGQR
ncbi:MAG: hypothetical protein RLZZ598_1712 [Pseudomonadota bacterium]|jgi:hypothetical protein